MGKSLAPPSRREISATSKVKEVACHVLVLVLNSTTAIKVIFVERDNRSRLSVGTPDFLSKD